MKLSYTEIMISAGAHFIFDLDDTLYLERDYLFSAFQSIAREIKVLTGHNYFYQMVRLHKSGANVFEWVETEFSTRSPSLTIGNLLVHYHTHQPSISLARGAGSFLLQLKTMLVPMGIITDGRSIGQRNKLKALGVETFFSDIIISEEFGSSKPSARNYEYFRSRYPYHDFYFFGDNTQKDFSVPHNFGWHCYCLKDNGYHIHPQAFNDQTPVNIISSFYDIRLIKNYIHEG